MKPDRSLLILGEPETAIAELGARARSLGFRTQHAKMPLDALERCRDRGDLIGVVLVDPELPVVDLAAALAPLRRELRIPASSILAAGPQPAGERLEQLRSAGIERALWTPVDDAALRFELNRALCGQPSTRARGTTRAPMGWDVQIYQGGRQKRASVYSLSPGGAFLETPRPAMRGAKIALELPNMPELGAIEVACRVLYTNVTGNISRTTLPHGMAVLFTELSDDLRSALLRCVERRSAQFSLVGPATSPDAW